MSSDLARSLVDAAAEADWTAHHVAVLKAIGKRGALEDRQREVSRARSRAVVAAALEALDAEVGRRVLADEEPVDLLGLAAEIREG